MEWHPSIQGPMSTNAHLKTLIRDWSKFNLSSKLEAYLQRSFSLLDNTAANALNPDGITEVSVLSTHLNFNLIIVFL
jgi:hypothetical protein